MISYKVLTGNVPESLSSCDYERSLESKGNVSQLLSDRTDLVDSVIQLRSVAPTLAQKAVQRKFSSSKYCSVSTMSVDWTCFISHKFLHTHKLFTLSSFLMELFWTNHFLDFLCFLCESLLFLDLSLWCFECLLFECFFCFDDVLDELGPSSIRGNSCSIGLGAQPWLYSCLSSSVMSSCSLGILYSSTWSTRMILFRSLIPFRLSTASIVERWSS